MGKDDRGALRTAGIARCMKETTLTRSLPLRVEEIYGIAFRDAEFARLFYKGRGEDDICIGEWSPSEKEGYSQCRRVTMTTKLSLPKALAMVIKSEVAGMSVDEHIQVDG